MNSILRPEILRRLNMFIGLETSRNPVIGQLSDLERESIQAVIEHARLLKNHRKPTRPAEAFFDILRVLVVH
jgi:hypothetical protein